MAGENKNRKQASAPENQKAEALWRKPITLEAVEDDDDPLAMLYQGREAGEQVIGEVKPLKKAAEKKAVSENKKANYRENPDAEKETSQKRAEERSETSELGNDEIQKSATSPTVPKISQSELKSILKIKSESFHFTDLREILRGKSFDIYAYLRFLSGDSGSCKIKHLDLMKKLDISRPTLFKQGEWLTRLSLIEKRNVPGDHLGTSYSIYRLEDVLPVSEALVEQLEMHVESLRQSSDSKFS